MLMLAKAQGEDLLALKAQTPHGGFKERIERETCLSYSTAKRYMLVAKRTVNGPFDLTGSISAFIGEPTQAARAKARPKLTRDDAEYILKINALAERGATEGERGAATSKLDGLAEQYRRTTDHLVKEAEKLCPDQHMGENVLSQKRQALAEFEKMNKDQLLEVIWKLLSRGPRPR
jgi:hypothetical protein